MSRIPELLREEAKAVEDQIRKAFKGVTREGGISWSGSRVVDDFGSNQEVAAAAKDDTERCWEDLVDDPAWRHDMGVGGFNFLDPIGFRYYIAPAMVRCTRLGYGEVISYALTIDTDYEEKRVSRIDPVQARAIARFVRFMIAAHSAVNDTIYGPPWSQAYRVYWKQFDT